MERGTSKGSAVELVGFSAAPSLETPHQFVSLTLSSAPREEGLRKTGHLGESGRGRFLVNWVFIGKAEAAFRRWTQARAAWRREPFLGGGSEGAAKAALCSVERL